MDITGGFQADLDKYYRIEFGDPRPPLRRRIKLWTTHFGFQCVAVYRLACFCRLQLRRGNLLILPLALVSETMCYITRLIHHVDIFAASIGPGFYIGHVGTIYLGRTSVGANFSVSHNVTIGVGIAGGAHGLPVIGDDVWVGSGSTLYGNISVGQGVTVNCGSVLSRSVADRCLVGGNPARVILRNYDNAELFRHHVAVAQPAPEDGDPGSITSIPESEPLVVKAREPECAAPAPLPEPMPSLASMAVLEAEVGLEAGSVMEGSRPLLQATTSNAMSLAAKASAAAGHLAGELGQMDILRQ